jgi:hypothetical protein
MQPQTPGEGLVQDALRTVASLSLGTWGGMTDTASILKDAGLKVHDLRIPGLGHLEIRGGMWHHDAVGPTTLARWIAMAQHGRPDLRGPLYNGGVMRDGAWVLITDQRANHAGRSSLITLNEATAGLASERDARDRGLLDDTTIGNRYFFGLCAANNGTDEPYPAGQIDSIAHGCAALNEAWGLTAGHWLHHRQASRRKIDMSFRGDLRSMIRAHQEDDDMAVTHRVGKDRSGRWWSFKSTDQVGVEWTQQTADTWWALGARDVFTNNPDEIELLKASSTLAPLGGRS